MEEAFAAQEVKAEQQQEVQQGLQTANNELEAANTDLHTALEHAASQIQVLEVPQPLCSLSLYAHSASMLTPPVRSLHLGVVLLQHSSSCAVCLVLFGLGVVHSSYPPVLSSYFFCLGLLICVPATCASLPGACVTPCMSQLFVCLYVCSCSPLCVPISAHVSSCWVI